MTELYFTRHGETVWNVENRLQGRLDSPLTEKGLQQARKLKEEINPLGIQVIYSSTAPRALRTAQIAGGESGIPIIPLEDLREFDMGLWEGRPIEEILKTEMENFRNLIENPWAYKPNTGEACYPFVERCQRALDVILKRDSHKKIFIVSHGMTIKGLLWRFSNKDFETYWKETKIIHQASLVHGRLDEEGKAWLVSVPHTFPWGEDLLKNE